MVDDKDSAPPLSGDLDEGTELPSDLVGGVDTRFLPDVGGEGVEDDEPCARLPDCLDQPFIRERQIPLLFTDEQQVFRVAPGADEAGDDGIVGIVLTGLVACLVLLCGNKWMREFKTCLFGKTACG